MKRLIKQLIAGLLCFSFSAAAVSAAPTLTNDSVILYSAESDEEYLSSAVSALGRYKLSPVFGRDTNICDTLKDKLLALGFEDIDVSVKSVNNTFTGGGIDNDGTIHYFYDNPDSFRFYWGVTSDVVFTLRYGEASAETSPYANIVLDWDEDKVRSYMYENVIDNMTFSLIGGENTDENNVISQLTLPQYYGNNRNVRISWESNNSAVISLKSPTGTVDDIVYGPYTGNVNQLKEDSNVTLTASFTFSRYELTETKEFHLTVPGADRNTALDDMQAILDGYTTDKIRLTSDGSSIGDGSAVTSDLKLLTPRELEIYDREYDIILTIDNAEDLEYINVPSVNNAARAYIFRPLPEEGDKTVSFTVTLSSTVYSGLTASKTFTVTIKALDSAELEEAAADMEYIKANFFEFIKGENSDKDNVTQNLSSFYGIYKENGILSAKSYIDRPNGSGVTAVCINPSAEADYRRYFQSGDTDIITDENLLVTRPHEDTQVSVTACLSNELYEAYLNNEYYPVKYSFDYQSKYSQNNLLKSVCRQLVSVDVTVKAAELKASVLISVIKDGSPIIAGDTSVNLLPLTVTDEDSDGILTIHDVFLILHGEYCEDGYKTDENGNITQLCSQTVRNLKIYKNNRAVGSVRRERVYSGDIINAVLDCREYGYFNLYETYQLIGGNKTTVLLSDENGSPIADAVIGELDENGSFIPLDGITTDSDGYVSLRFNTAGIKYISAQNAENTLTVPSFKVNITDSLIPAETITISKSTASLEAGKTMHLGTEIYPYDATDKIVIWKSSNPEVASVNSNGMVTALKSGKTTITALCDSPEYEYASCIVIVTEKSGSSSGGGHSDKSFSVSFKLTGLNNRTWISKTTLSGITSDNTVFDIFKTVLSDNGFTYKGSGSYISSVTNASGTTLSEFDHGANSGWMYSVDDEIPTCSMNKYYLAGGEEIVFFYTGDYTTVSGSSSDYYTPSKTDNTAQPSPSPSPSEKAETDTSHFADVNESNWFCEAVYAAYNKKLFNGTSDTAFSPYDGMTRAMLATVLHRMDGSPSASGRYFDDVEEGTWYAEAVAWAASKKIVNGIGGNEFAPEQFVTREQLAVMLYNYRQKPTYENSYVNAFTDIDNVSEWAKDAVLWATADEIITGREDMTIDPKTYVTRAEAAAMLIRFAEKYE